MRQKYNFLKLIKKIENLNILIMLRGNGTSTQMNLKSEPTSQVTVPHLALNQPTHSWTCANTKSQSNMQQRKGLQPCSKMTGFVSGLELIYFPQFVAICKDCDFLVIASLVALLRMNLAHDILRVSQTLCKQIQNSQ